jgi:outer membrane protein OmpA-like peptidoglycan-associated protein
MKLIVSKPRAVAALVVGSAAISACASSQKQLTAPQQAAAQAEEQAQKAQNEAQKAREASDKTQRDLAEAQQTHNEAKQAELMADQRATEASRRAAVAEAQAGLAAKPAAIPPASAQAQGGAQKSEKGVAEAQGHEGGGKVKIITASLLFKTGSAELMPSAKSQLDEVAQALSAQPQANNVKVQGYTDSTGTAAINDPLSMKRAETVADYLESKGVPKDRVTAEGFGKKDPVSTANTTEGHALNRRVDIVVEPVEGRAMPQAEPQQGQPQKGQPSKPPPSQPPPSQPPPSQPQP